MSVGWGAGPLAAFDVESTGVDVERDRIVTACVAVVNVDPTEPSRTWLADPGVDIPAEATAVHGVTTEHARAHGRPPRDVLVEIRGAILDAWYLGRPVVAYNAPYDFTVLDREFRRHGVEPLRALGPVIDPLVLDRYVDPRRRGPRKLVNVVEHYGVRLDGAHDATQDALAAARVAWRIAQRYPDIAALDWDDLFALQVDAHAAWAESFEAYLRSQGKGDVIDRAWPIRRAAVAA